MGTDPTKDATDMGILPGGVKYFHVNVPDFTKKGQSRSTPARSAPPTSASATWVRSETPPPRKTSWTSSPASPPMPASTGTSATRPSGAALEGVDVRPDQLEP